MKCHDPDNDRTADLAVFVNGLPVPEYDLPPVFNPNYGPRTLACFVPVSEDDVISVRGVFTGTILHGSFDLLADGCYLADRRVEGARTGEIKAVKRTINFSKVFNMPPGKTNPVGAAAVEEGELTVKLIAVPPTNTGADKDNYGVGSIVVNVSVNDNDDDKYSAGYDNESICGSWQERDTSQMDDGGIAPTLELDMTVTDSDVHTNRQSKHRRHARQARFGNYPWATLVFFYRTHMDIKAAKCELRKGESLALGSVMLYEDHVKVNEALGEQRMRERNVSKRTSDEEFTSPTPAERKRRLFGQVLMPETTSATMPEPMHLPPTIPETSPRRAPPGIDTSARALHAPRLLGKSIFGKIGAPSSHPPARLSPIQEEEPVPVFSNKAAFHRSPSPEEAPENNMWPEIPAIPSSIREMGNTPGESFGYLKQPSPAAVPNSISGKTTSKSAHGSATPIAMKTDTGGLFVEKVATRNSPEVNPSNFSIKRARSVSSASQESARSGKKPRISERKAALLAQLEEKTRRNEAAKKDLEEQRKRREQEERRRAEEEAEENAELERLIAAQDEEFGLLLQASKDEEETWYGGAD